MVKNLAEEIIESPVDKNWTNDFVKQHSDRLKSLYLKNIDSKKKKFEHVAFYKQYYDLMMMMMMYSYPVCHRHKVDPYGVAISVLFTERRKSLWAIKTSSPSVVPRGTGFSPGMSLSVVVNCLPVYLSLIWSSPREAVGLGTVHMLMLSKLVLGYIRIHQKFGRNLHSFIEAPPSRRSRPSDDES